MTAMKTERAWATGQAERGSVLIITLLMLLTVTSLGLLAVRGSRSELTTAGSHRFSRTALYIGEAALNAGIERIGNSADAFLAVARLNNNKLYADEDTLDGVKDGVADMFDSSPEGSLGRLAATPKVWIIGRDPFDSNTVAGFSTNAVQFCHKKITFTGLGQLEPNDMVIGFGTTVRVRAHAHVGPLTCGM